MARLPKSFRLTPESVALLRKLSERLGVSKAAIVEMGIRKLARDEGIQAHGKSEEGK